MANRLMKIDEVCLEIGIPMLRAQVKAAARCFAGSDRDSAIVRNPVADLMPLQFERAGFDEPAMLAKVDEVEAQIRARIEAQKIVSPTPATTSL